MYICMHHMGLLRYIGISWVHTMNYANWFPPQIHTTWYEYHGIKLSCLYQRRHHPLSASQSLEPLQDYVPFVYYLHLLRGQVSFSTVEHSGVAHHCLNTQPCHQWYHISMPNRVKCTLLHQHSNLCQICLSPSLPPDHKPWYAQQLILVTG